MTVLKKIRLSYNRLSIRVKLTICVVLAALIPVAIIAVMFSGRLYNMMIADTIRDMQLASDNIAPKIEASLASITECHQKLRSLEYYRQLFEAPLDQELADLADSREAHSFAAQVQQLVDDSPLTAVRLYLNLPAAEASFFEQETAMDLFLPISACQGTYWYGIFQSGNYPSLHCPPLYLGPVEASCYGDCAYICRCHLNYEGTLYPCYIALYYPSEIYTDVLADSIDVPDCVSYLINERDAVIAATDASLSGIYRLSYSDVQDSLMSSNSFIERDVVGNRVYTAFHYIREANWLMVTVIPRDPLIQIANRTIYYFIVICAVCILLAICIALTQTLSLTSRISLLIGQMTKIRTGTPVSMPEPAIQDEVGQLISTYNYMTKTMEQLMEAQRKASEELRISEFNALQAQINPHFLYNMMDVINWMVLQGKAQEASSAIQTLARFYKLTLRRRGRTSTLKDELEHVNIYMELQSMRYLNAFEFVVDMPDELSNYQIPQLTLQPIVENSILHGILETPEKTGTIVITGWQEDGDICILVSDDGVGVPADILPRILSSDKNHHTKGSNIAVYNIHNRLQLLYGEDYGLSYSSVEGQGCEVTIRIPMCPAAST